MMKLSIIFLSLIGMQAIAQNREIEFQSAEWETHLATATIENKLIFFDAYTTWCAPCKVMARDVFTQDEVADMFNSNFINVKYDMEKGEGIALKSKYDVTAFPTYLFINGAGDLVHKIVGSMPAEDFLKEASIALNPENSLYTLSRKFEESGQSDATALAYLEALNKAYEHEKISKVSKIYFDRIPEAKLLDEYYWNLAQKYLNNPSSKAFNYLYNNRESLKTKYEANEVNNYFNLVLSSSVYRVKNAYKKNTGIKEAEEITKAMRALLNNLNSASFLQIQ